MDKIYGYKQKDVIGLAEFLAKKGSRSLSSVFAEYGAISGKAKGTVRNLYYALAKKSNSDKEFCEKYLNGKPIKISNIVEFDPIEEKELIKSILKSKSDGKSTRSIIMQMADFDAKKALRYQNKFRNAIKTKPQLIAEITKEIESEGGCAINLIENKKNSTIISPQQFDRLKLEIDFLVQRIASKIKKENEYLKQRLGVLEKENLKLLGLLYGSESSGDARKFFKNKADKQFIN